MMLKKMTWAAAILAVALFGGVGGIAYRSWAAGDGPKKETPAEKSRPAADAPKDDDAIQGVWRVAAMETEGVERDDDVARDVKKQTWTIRGDQLVVHVEAPGPAHDAKFTYSINAARTPKTIDLTSEQAAGSSPLKSLHGVYSVEGDVLKFCYAMPGAEMEHWNDLIGKRREGIREVNVLLPAGPRPKEVATKDGSKSTLLTLKREAAAKADPKEATPTGDADAEKIQGTWVAVAAEMDGRPAPPEAIEVVSVIVGADKLTFNPAGENRPCLYKLDPTKTPKGIELTPQDGPAKGKAVQGLYDLDGDRLKLCLLNGPGEGPKDFATKPGSNLRLLVLKRKPADDEHAAKSRDDREAIRGVWQVTDVETNDKKNPGLAGALPKIKTQEWVFTGDKVGVRTPGEKDAPPADYTLDPAKNPKQIDVRPEKGNGELGSGVYSLEGDVLKLCFPGPGNGPRPTELAADEAGKNVFLTLKRVEPGGDAPKADKTALALTEPPAQSAGPRSDKEQTLLKDWCDTANKAFNLRKERFGAGSETSEALVGAARRLLTAEMERAEKKEDRVAACEAHLRRITEVAKVVKAREAAGQGTVADVADAEYYRLEAEILLEREKAK